LEVLPNSVLLVQPPELNVLPDFKRTPPIGFGFPIGLGYLAAVLEQNGVQVHILDAQFQRLSPSQVLKEVELQHPEVVGITTYTPNIRTAVKIGQLVKKHTPAKVVMGGPHASFDHSLLFQHHSCDIIVYGEGEYTFLDLLKALKANSNLSQVQGICYLENGHLKITPPRKPIENLDELPFPARHLVDFKRYLSSHENVVQVITSRGCVFRCVFCSSSHLFQKWRARTPENIIAELNHIKSKYPQTKHVEFMDDLFTHDLRRIFRLCELMLDHRLNLTWNCLTRVTDINEDLLRIMAKAGCIQINYGVESGDTQILKNIRKGITPEQCHKAIELTHKTGIKTNSFFMIGNPGENHDSIQKTMRFARALAKSTDTFPLCFITTVYPGTELACLYELKRGSVDWVNYIYSPEIRKPVWFLYSTVPVYDANLGLDREVLKRYYVEFYRQFLWRNMRYRFSRFLRNPRAYLLFFRKTFNLRRDKNSVIYDDNRPRTIVYDEANSYEN